MRTELTMGRCTHGDIGRTLTITFPYDDISQVSSITLVIRKPSGEILTKTATVINETTAQYTTEIDVLTESGEYEVQGIARWDNSMYHGSLHSFTAGRRIGTVA